MLRINTENDDNFLYDGLGPESISINLAILVVRELNFRFHPDIRFRFRILPPDDGLDEFSGRERKWIWIYEVQASENDR